MAFDDVEKASLPALAEMMHGDVIRVNQKTTYTEYRHFHQQSALQIDNSLWRTDSTRTRTWDLLLLGLMFARYYGAEFGSAWKTNPHQAS